MPSTFGNALKVTVFGQSHSDSVGCVIEGLPSGHVIDMEALQAFLDRRAPGKSPWSTARSEADRPRFLSGLNDSGVTCGAPLAAVIENTNTRSQDYAELRRVPRPGHADFTAQAKWHGAQDVAGGGHFSGRLTAPLCIAGGIAKQLLAERGVRVCAHLYEVAGEQDLPLSALDMDDASRAELADQIDGLERRTGFPVIDQAAGERMIDEILDAKKRGDSVGGIVECVATGMPAGVGSPMFDGLDSMLARAALAIPAVKGVEFGVGFSAAVLYGSENNDPYGFRDGQAVPTKNDAGGILGGITTGAPVLFRIAMKPTSSIAMEQDSIDLVNREPARLVVRGRHDPCVAPRAVPVAEAVMACTLLDAWLSYPPDPIVNEQR